MQLVNAYVDCSVCRYIIINLNLKERVHSRPLFLNVVSFQRVIC